MNEEMLHAYMDGELTAAEVAEVERVLASGADCDAYWVSEYEQLLAVDTSIGELPGLRLNDDATAWARDCVARAVSVNSGPVEIGPMDTGTVPDGARIGRLLRLVGPLVAAAAALVLVVLSGTEPETQNAGVSPMVFSIEEQAQYLYWEADADTFGSGDLQSLESEILAALEMN